MKACYSISPTLDGVVLSTCTMRAHGENATLARKSPANNLVWFKIQPACVCDKCYELLMSGQWREFRRILAEKRIKLYMVSYARAGGLYLPFFEKGED